MPRERPSPLAQTLQRLAVDGSPVARELFLASLMRDADETTVPTLEAALGSGDSRIQSLAVEALGALGGPRVVPPLKRALLGRDLELRRRAAAALCRAGELSVPDLCDTLQHPEWDVRARAAEALGSIRDGRAVGPLCRRLEDTHELVRIRSVRALAEIRDTRAVTPLCASLTDPSETVVLAAIEALRRIGSQGACEPLLELLEGRRRVAKRALEAALALGWEPTLEQPRAMVLSALLTEQWERLARLRGRAVEPLREALTSGDPELELRAALALHHLARRHPSPELAAALPILRQRLRSRGREAHRAPFRAALQAIERSVGRAYNLPLPSAGAEPGVHGLPRPARPAPPSAVGLPRAAFAHLSVRPRSLRWWRGLLQWAWWTWK